MKEEKVPSSANSQTAKLPGRSGKFKGKKKSNASSHRQLRLLDSTCKEQSVRQDLYNTKLT
jgi:hypothetical protein